MMKQMRFKWKYLLASLLLANNIACSNDDLSQMVSRQEHDSGTRTAELVTQTIKLEEAGTLEAKVSEAMGDSAVSTLEKLVLSGPFTSTDMQYVRDSLTGLKVLDMDSVQIKASDVPYNYDTSYYWSQAYFGDNELCARMFQNLDNLEEVVLPSSISAISAYAFYDCGALRNVVMPEQLTTINGYAFYNCDSLRTVTLPDNITNILAAAFCGCESLSSIKLPARLKELGSRSFQFCGALTSVEMPDSVTLIGDNAFQYCYSLETVLLPKELRHIGSGAFANCPLKKLELPEKVETICSYAFESSGLRELIIPASVTSVDNYFIYNCSSLRTLIWNSTTLDVPNSASYGMFDCILFVVSEDIAVANINEWKGIVINGETESTINVDFNSAYTHFFGNYKEFKAKKLVYNRYFGDETKPGFSSGWQTIVLPFTPDSIYHETKGQIAPFNSGIEGAKPFWLRELTSDGFVDVTKIEANKPYIIAMPNHSEYLEEYRLNGTITFVARDSILRVTPEVLDASIGPDFEFHPTFNRVGVSSDIYALTDVRIYYEDDVWVNYYKSVFEKDRYDVYAFNGYVTTLGGGRSSRSMFDLDTRSKKTRASWIPNKTGIPQIGDM